MELSSTPTTWHCHFDLDYLIAQPDAELASILTGGTPVEMRAELICMRAAGKKYFVGGSCDNKEPNRTAVVLVTEQPIEERHNAQPDSTEQSD